MFDQRRPPVAAGIPPDWPEWPLMLPPPVVLAPRLNNSRTVIEGTVYRNQHSGKPRQLLVRGEARIRHILNGFGFRWDERLQAHRHGQPGVLLAIAPFLTTAQRGRLEVPELDTLDQPLLRAPAIIRVSLVDGQFRFCGHSYAFPYADHEAWIFCGQPLDSEAVRAAGWRWQPALRMWWTAHLRNTAAFAAFTTDEGKRRLVRAGIPASLHPWLRHAPAMFPWRARWGLALRASRHTGYSPPDRAWARSSPGLYGYSTRSATAAWRMRVYAPAPLQAFLDDTHQHGSLRSLRPHRLNLVSTARPETGGIPPKRRIWPVRKCDRCKKVSADLGIMRGTLCTEARCGNRVHDLAFRDLAAHRNMLSLPVWLDVALELGARELKAQRRIPPVGLDEVDAICPAGRKLRALQKAAILWHLARPVSLDATVIGGGKTISALTAAAILLGAGRTDTVPAGSVLAIVPASLREKWRYEAEHWLPAGFPLAVCRRGERAPPNGIVIASYETVRDQPHFRDRRWSAIIIDEAHYVKEADSLRTRRILRLTAGNWMFLTGTPIYNRPTDLQTLLSLAAPDAFGDGPKLRQAVSIADPRDPNPAEQRMLLKLSGFLREHLMWRPAADEVHAELPAKLPPEIVPIRIGSVDEIRDKEQGLLDRLRDGQGNFEVLAQLQALRKRAAVEKLPAIHDHVRQLTDAGLSVVSFSWHTDIAERLAQAADDQGIAATFITGKLSEKVQNQRRRSFRNGQVQYLSATYGAVGEGHDLPEADAVGLVEIDWTPSSAEQAEGRAQRAGRTSRLRTFWYVAEGTIDSYIAPTATGKAEIAADGLGDRDIRQLLARLAA